VSRGPFIVPRAVWTGTDPGGDLQKPSSPILFVHYTASPGRGIDSRKKRIDAMRAFREHHVVGNGWSDIGYNFVLFQPTGKIKKARIWKGRGRYRVPAAQLDHNAGNLAVSVVTDGNEPISKETVKAIAKLARKINARAIEGHRDVNSTSCPGDRLYKKLPSIRKLAGL
jgi:hypothetical protein